MKFAEDLGLLAPGFRRNTPANGVVREYILTSDLENPINLQRNTECATCHLEFFTPNHVVLSPSLPILNYLDQYLDDDKGPRKPLQEERPFAYSYTT